MQKQSTPSFPFVVHLPDIDAVRPAARYRETMCGQLMFVNRKTNVFIAWQQMSDRRCLTCGDLWKVYNRDLRLKRS